MWDDDITEAQVDIEVSEQKNSTACLSKFIYYS